ncbi:hypothetical protein Q73_10470 [Bacillus coahuilensis m2-6]|nr:hypothetical protein Q73_10470 [Bacillus coahuilensis m2-6]
MGIIPPLFLLKWKINFRLLLNKRKKVPAQKMRKPAPDESEPARETVGAARNLGISAQKKVSAQEV